MPLPKSPDYTKTGHEALAAEVDALLPKLTDLSDPNTRLKRWDGKVGTGPELIKLSLEETRAAVNEPSGGDWIDLGTKHGIKREYHRQRSEAGNGNRFFRYKAVVKVPPQLFVAALLEPTILGSVDATIRHVRVVHNYPDGVHRLVVPVAEAGPRPFFYDRDDCALSAFFPPEVGGEGAWWQVSCTVPDAFPSVKSAVRNWTMYWGYKLEPFKDEATGATHTRLTLVSQTEIFGWLPKFMVNRLIYDILVDYIRTLEEHLVEMLERGAPAKMLVESYGLHL